MKNSVMKFVIAAPMVALLSTAAFAQEEGLDPSPDADGSVAAPAALSTSTADAGMFDTDTGMALADTDGDGFPDLTESAEGTNPLDGEFFPGSEEDASDLADFPASTCRAGFRQAGARLCISTNVHNARTFANAQTFCRDRRSNVASYSDLRYLYVRSGLDAAYNPSGRWIGNVVDDDRALCGNRSITFNNDPDIANFEGECSRFDSRNFWCAHDDQ